MAVHTSMKSASHLQLHTASPLHCYCPVGDSTYCASSNPLLAERRNADNLVKYIIAYASRRNPFDL
jgi:hypothetical protein